MANLIFITIALVLIGVLLLFITKGKTKYTLILNYGVAILPLSPYLISVVMSLFSDEVSDTRIFSYLGVEIISFSIVLLVFGISFFPLVISLISKGIYRTVTLPKNSRYVKKRH